VTRKMVALAAAAAFLMTSSVAGLATASIPGNSAGATQVKAVDDVSAAKKKKKKMSKKKGMKQNGSMAAPAGTGASTPVPGGMMGGASGTSGTDKKPGPPSSKTR
jgi:hypothetical protein